MDQPLFLSSQQHGHTPLVGTSSEPQPFVVLQFCILSIQVQSLIFRKWCQRREGGSYHLSIHHHSWAYLLSFTFLSSLSWDTVEMRSSPEEADIIWFLKYFLAMIAFQWIVYCSISLLLTISYLPFHCSSNKSNMKYLFSLQQIFI